MQRLLYPVFFFLLATGSLKIQSQQLKSFSEEPAKYIEEIKGLLGGNLSEENQLKANNFEHFWLSGAFSIDEQMSIIRVSNEFLVRRARPVPYFISYLSALSQFKQTSHDTASYRAWEKGLLSLLKDRRTQLSVVNKYLNIAVWLISEQILFKSSSTQWKASTDDFAYQYDSVVFITFSNTDLTCYAQRDSGSIEQTSGKFYPVTVLWKGEKGTVTWERAGYSKNDVFAELSNYEINMTKSQYKADSVLFTNSYYFTEPLLGVLEDKITRISNPERAICPRFDSYTKRIFIEDIYENIDYDGGFSMQGAKMNGSGSKWENARLSVYRNDTLHMQVRSLFFVFRNDRITSNNTSITLYLAEDSIYHPRIAFNYNVNNRELSLYRTDDIMMQSPYFNSYHRINMEFERLNWIIDEPIMKFTMAKGASLGQARFESNNYFNINQYYRIQAMDEEHPLFTLKRFADWYYSDEFPVEELAKWMRKQTYQIIQLCIRLSNDGFVYYNETTGEVTLKQRLYDYIDAFTGYRDYDVIDFVSNTNAPLENASLDLETLNLTINGVPQIFISDSQNVVIYPRQNKIILKRNRNFLYDGKVQAGLFTFYGEKFSFDYDSFKINLQAIDSLNISIQSDEIDVYGNHYLIEIQNIIELVTGNLLIDAPNNKSGLLVYPEYPVFNSNENSFVYYENVSGLDSIYNREDFYFELEPYTISSLDKFSKEDVAFKGSFKSGNIFPEITQTLRVQEDNSLGFKLDIPEEGLPVYDGKGTFYHDLEMSNRGLEGSGELVYLGSTTRSENFQFLPDSMNAIARTFEVSESGSDDLFPMVKATNVRVNWHPFEDEWYTYRTAERITMFNEETQLDGSLKMTPAGISGSGTMTMPDAALSSENFVYKKSYVDADTANFHLNSIRSEGYAFIAEDVNAHIDFSRGKGLFSSNQDTSLVKFPENQYISTLDNFNWNMEFDELVMGKKVKSYRRIQTNIDPLNIPDAPLEKPTFVSINTRHDSLGFASDSAVYNLKENLITAYNVTFIEIADALISPKDGIVEVENRAQIRRLEDAQIFANRTHSIYSASVNILNSQEYEASGKYNYTDEELNTQIIAFDDIKVNETGHTIASGNIIPSDEFTLNPAFEYVGKVNLDAEKEFLTFTGGVRITHNCEAVERRFMKFTAEIDPNNVMIPVLTEPRDINGNRIFNGHFITNDSSHIYTAFLSWKKIYSDNPISTAEGFLFFDNGSGKYKIGSLEKLSDESIPGQFLTFDRNYCELYGEGKLNLAVDFGQFSISTVGNATHNIETNEAGLNIMIGLNFYFLTDAITVMANEIDAHPTLEAIDRGSTAYQKGIAELVGTDKANAIREEVNLYGRITELPAEMQYTILLTHLNLVWNTETSSYRSVGKIGIGNILNTQLNVMVDGFVEIQKKRSGDLFDIYLKTDDNTWYYFGYSRGVMQSLSSNKEYNSAIVALNENQRRLKVNSGEVSYIYMVAVNRKLTSFLRRFRDAANEGDPDIQE